MSKITNAILSIIENPLSKKAYKDWEAALKAEGQLREALAVSGLTETRFHDSTNHSSTNKE